MPARLIVFLFAFPLLNLAQIPDPGPLTNQRVIQLVQSGVRADEVFRAIATAPSCSFNLTPSDVDQLLRAGVSEETIKAMSARQNGQTYAASPTRSAGVNPGIRTNSELRPVVPSSHPQTTNFAKNIEIPEGTKVRCRLEQTISSATAEQGQQVQLSVTEDVKNGNTIVIAQGATVVGTIVTAQGKRRMGRTGKLDFSIDRVMAVDGEFVPLRYTIQKREGGSNAVMSGVLTAGVAVLFWPAAPVMLLIKGKDVQINKGIIFETFTDSKHVSEPTNEPSSVTPERLATVVISSEKPGADIEIDGAFVGSTPTTQMLTSGHHRVSVKSGANVWERDLQVSPGASINLIASFAK
jgi:hypothetical protein